jgi:ubiquinone/menaquinone biosynthesis C-methylase UbiE/Mn-dependent DtxR family transcriptional regulator
MGDIATMLDITPSSATDLVNYLEREGFVCRIQNEQNRRSILVKPTQKGEEWILETEEKIYGFLASRMTRLSPQEQAQFADLCERFTGVSDVHSFDQSILAFKQDRGARIPLRIKQDGKFRRLEEIVSEQFSSRPSPRETMKFEKRIPETNDGIQDEITVEQYDQMQKSLRDNHHLPVQELVGCTKEGYHALEIGPGPGYLGLEWLSHTDGTTLTGLEISLAMIRVAEQNTAQYGLSKRATYTPGNALQMPFEEKTFDLVFSNGSLHEWEDATQVFAEIFRVLKPGGTVSISDLRRDITPEIYQMMLSGCQGSEISKGFETSVRAAYTRAEAEDLIKGIGFSRTEVIVHPFGLVVIAQK